MVFLRINSAHVKALEQSVTLMWVLIIQGILPLEFKFIATPI